MFLQNLKELLFVEFGAVCTPKQLFPLYFIVGFVVIISDVEAADRHRLLSITLGALKQRRLEKFIWKARNAQLFLFLLTIGICILHIGYYEVECFIRKLIYLAQGLILHFYLL